MPSTLPINKRKLFDLRYHSSKVNFFCSFFELKITKRHFEINWPLVVETLENQELNVTLRSFLDLYGLSNNWIVVWFFFHYVHENLNSSLERVSFQWPKKRLVQIGLRIISWNCSGMKMKMRLNAFQKRILLHFAISSTPHLFSFIMHNDVWWHMWAARREHSTMELKPIFSYFWKWSLC